MNSYLYNHRSRKKMHVTTCNFLVDASPSDTAITAFTWAPRKKQKIVTWSFSRLEFRHLEGPKNDHVTIFGGMSFQGDEEKEISEEDTEYLKVQIKTQNKLTTKRVDKHIVWFSVVQRIVASRQLFSKLFAYTTARASKFCVSDGRRLSQKFANILTICAPKQKCTCKHFLLIEILLDLFEMGGASDQVRI